MKKILMLIVALMIFIFNSLSKAQDGALRDKKMNIEIIKDKDFIKIFSQITSSYKDNFRTLPKTLNFTNPYDTTYDLLVKFNEVEQATLNYSAGSTVLVESFKYRKDMKDLEKLLATIRGALPDDFIYSCQYDLLSKFIYIDFHQNPESKQIHTGFPEHINVRYDEYFLLSLSITNSTIKN